VLAFVRESRESHTRGGVDVGGALLSVVGFGGVVFALIEGRHYGWWTTLAPLEAGPLRWTASLSPVPVALAVGLVALAAFGVVETRRNRAGKVVLLDLALFGIPSFRNGNLTAAVVSLGEFGLLFALPLWFQNVRGYTAFETGLALLPLAVGSFLASGFGGQLAQRRGAPLVVRLGIVLEVLGVAGIGVVLRPDAAWWVTVPFLFVYGMGVGLATAQLTGVALVDVPVEQSGQGSGTQSTSRQIGSALGIAVLGTVLFVSLGGLLGHRLDAATSLPAGPRDRVVSAVVSSAGAAITGLDRSPATHPAAEQARAAFTDATRYAAFSAAGFLALGFLASLSLGGRKLVPTKR
jgi:hypothetical protein